MLRSIQSLARAVALCSAVVAAPTLADAGEWSGRGGSERSGSAVFVGPGGQVNRGISFGFDDGRGVAVVGGGVAVVGGGRRGSFERYDGGRRQGSTTLGSRDRFYGDGVVVFDRSDVGRYQRLSPRDRWEARRERFEDRRRYQADNSFIRLRDSGRIDRFERDSRYDRGRDGRGRDVYRDRTTTTFGGEEWDGGGVVSYGTPYPGSIDGVPLPFPGPVGPKIIDVETERLDRRPIGPSGLDVVITGGGSKIVRIAPGYRMAGAVQARTPTAQNRRPAGINKGGLGLQPWSTGWLRYCQRTHRSFDPDLGTYVTENGRVRFCAAE